MLELELDHSQSPSFLWTKHDDGAIVTQLKGLHFYNRKVEAVHSSPQSPPPFFKKEGIINEDLLHEVHVLWYSYQNQGFVRVA
jgi:hypothetical protein